MKNPDEAIERVLTSLREAEAPQGMEHRILQAISNRAPALSRWPSMLANTQPWAIAATAIVIVSMAATLTLHRRNPIVQEESDQKTLTSPAAATTQGEVATAALPSPQNAATVSLQKPTAPKTEAISEEDALAISEMLAPSKPAPPLPLTHQEKLLAEVVHHGAPEELATLRPDVRAKQIEISKAEFHDFFEPPPAKDNE